MNLQVIATGDGDSCGCQACCPHRARPTAARIWAILRELAAAGLVVLADKGYYGAGDHIRTPTREE